MIIRFLTQRIVRIFDLASEYFPRSTSSLHARPTQQFRRLWASEMLEDRAMLSAGNFMVIDANTTFQSFDYVGGVTANDQLYFFGQPEEGVLGNEFWRYNPAANDGTGQFTWVANIQPRRKDSDGPDWKVFDGKIYFLAEDASGIDRFYRFDPDANAGAGSLTIVGAMAALAESASYLTLFNDKFYFNAYDIDHGREMWEYDPAGNDGAGAVRLVADLYPGSAASSPRDFVEANGRLYFVATNETAGREVHQFDPTANGGAGEIRLTADLFADSMDWRLIFTNEEPLNLLEVDGAVYFVGYAPSSVQFWKWDPNAADGEGAATLVAENRYVAEWAAVGDKIYYSHRTSGELIRFDPAAANGVGEFTVVRANPFNFRSTYSRDFAVVEEVLYFVGDVGTTNDGLWKIDPTSNDGMPTNLTTFHNIDAFKGIVKLGENLYFSEGDQQPPNVIWNDYTPDYTLRTFDLAGEQDIQTVRYSSLTQSSNLSPLAEFEGKLYFVAESGDEKFRLWQYDPDADGGQGSSHVIASFEEGDVYRGEGGIAVLNGQIYFWVNFPDSTDELWRFDPATEVVKFVSTNPTNVKEMLVADDKIFMTLFTFDYGQELWSFRPGADGQLSLSHLEVDINPGSDSSNPHSLQRWNDKIVFTAYTPDFGYEPLLYDPKTGRIEVLADIEEALANSSFTNFTPVGNKLYFQAGPTPWETKLYLYDPDGASGAGSTSLVSDKFSFGEIVVLDGKLYFYGGDRRDKTELWEYDPNANNGAGQLLRPTLIHYGLNATEVRNLASYNGKLYFQATFSTAMTRGTYVGNELWSYDPATAEIILVDDLNPITSSSPQDFFVADNTLYYTAFTSTYGRELYAYQDNFSPIAYDDHYEVMEDIPLSIDGLGVLANDRSPNHDPLTASLVSGPSHGDLILNDDGSFLYSPSENYYGADSFIYEVREPDGEVSQAEVKLTILPENDPATIGGTRTGEAAEDDPTPTSGKLSITDIDAGEDQFQSQSNTASQYGQFSLTSDGSWTYLLDSQLVQHLGATDTAQDILVVTSWDGATSETLVITITGANDAATIGGDTTGTTNEDSTDALVGLLTIIDPDANQSQFVPRSDTSNPYGTFQIDAMGHWTFNADPKVNELAAQTSLELSFPVSSLDGTDSIVRITIEGRDDATSLSSLSTTTQEDHTSAITGQLSLLDVDLNAETRFAGQTEIEGSFGYFSIDSNGHWTYTLEIERTQFLGVRETASDRFDVMNAQGEFVGQFSILIEGRNDSPVPSILPVSEVRRAGLEVIYLANSNDFDSSPQDMSAQWEVFQTDQAEPLLSQQLIGAEEFRFTLSQIGQYEIRVVITDEHGARGVATRSLTIGNPSQVSLNFAEEGALLIGTVNESRSKTDQILHEWQDVPLQIWMTVDHDVVDAAFDFQWEVLITNPLFGGIQTVDQLGSNTDWELVAQSEGWLLKGLHTALDLSAFTVGDRILLATIWLPRNLDDMAGLSMDTQGAYPEASLADGIELRSASLVDSTVHAFSIIAGNQATISPVIYDANDDGRVSLADFAAFVANFGKQVEPTNGDAYRFDYDHNGKVALSDFSYFVQHFGYRKDRDVPQVDMPHLTLHLRQSSSLPPRESEPLGNILTFDSLPSTTAATASSPTFSAFPIVNIVANNRTDDRQYVEDARFETDLDLIVTKFYLDLQSDAYRLIDAAIQDETIFAFEWPDERPSDEDTPDFDVLSF